MSTKAFFGGCPQDATSPFRGKGGEDAREREGGRGRTRGKREGGGEEGEEEREKEGGWGKEGKTHRMVDGKRGTPPGIKEVGEGKGRG